MPGEEMRKMEYRPTRLSLRPISPDTSEKKNLWYPEQLSRGWGKQENLRRFRRRRVSNTWSSVLWSDSLTTVQYKAKFWRAPIGWNGSRDAIMCLLGERLSTYSARFWQFSLRGLLAVTLHARWAGLRATSLLAKHTAREPVVPRVLTV